MGKEELPEEEAGVDPDGEGSTVASRLQGEPWEVRWGPWRWWEAAGPLNGLGVSLSRAGGQGE